MLMQMTHLGRWFGLTCKTASTNRRKSSE